jgi:large subunit ribosomal protein L3
MGTDVVSVQNLKIVGIDAEQEVMLVAGSIPGPKKGLVVVKSAIKGTK